MNEIFGGRAGIKHFGSCTLISLYLATEEFTDARYGNSRLLDF